MRKCKKCGQEKNDEDFALHGGSPKARRNTCKVCHNKWQSENRLAYFRAYRKKRHVDDAKWREKRRKLSRDYYWKMMEADALAFILRRRATWRKWYVKVVLERFLFTIKALEQISKPKGEK